jgi:hypothetical protein
MTAYHLMKSFFGIPSPITPEHCVDFGIIGYVTHRNVLKNKYKPRAFKCYMGGYTIAVIHIRYSDTNLENPEKSSFQEM